MDKFENTQANNENREAKQHYIPMEVTPETLRDFAINPADVVWTRIGNKPKKVIMIPVTEERYYEYMRPLWREDKRHQRQEPLVSLDKMYKETEYEAADTSGLEADIMKQIMIDELYKAFDDLEEIDRELSDVLIAISVVSRRIADRISVVSGGEKVSMEGGSPNGKSKRIVHAR